MFSRNKKMEHTTYKDILESNVINTIRRLIGCDFIYMEDGDSSEREKL
jgi:hypothetical protein